jgi:2',3'-cyclic-nucleotide 2'-phosphodiesterase
MKSLILGDIFGKPGLAALSVNLKNIIDIHKINFVIANGENAAENGLGITKEIANKIFESGVDVITSGNHIWDKKDIIEYIDKESRLLRPANLIDGSPGRGFGYYKSKCKFYNIAVINLMGNVYMKKSQNAFNVAKSLSDQIVLKENADFIFVDFHCEVTSEKQAMGYFFDGKVTALVGTHTHVPTADTRILKNGTGYQTDIGMCGDYDSVIGMNKENSLMTFLQDKNASRNFPAEGKATICGVMIDCDEKTGLCKEMKRFDLNSKII